MDSGFESRVLAALQKLLAVCLQAPGVDLIDTGPDPGTGSTVLQVHVRNPASQFRLGPFEAIDGIPCGYSSRDRSRFVKARRFRAERGQPACTSAPLSSGSLEVLTRPGLGSVVELSIPAAVAHATSRRRPVAGAKRGIVEL